MYGGGSLANYAPHECRTPPNAPAERRTPNGERLAYLNEETFSLVTSLNGIRTCGTTASPARILLVDQLRSGLARPLIDRVHHDQINFLEIRLSTWLDSVATLRAESRRIKSMPCLAASTFMASTTMIKYGDWRLTSVTPTTFCDPRLRNRRDRDWRTPRR
jgi:hypothetical protein